MELKWLEDFVAVVRMGSFSSAANERNVTQPAFSRRIRSLEHWLGVQLFDRSTLPVELTQYGEEFMPHAMQMIETAVHAQQDFRASLARDETLVRLSTLHSLSIDVVPSIIEPFLDENPRARVEIYSSVQGVEAHYDALESGASHMLMVYSRNWNGRHQRLVKKLLSRDVMMPVVSREFAKRNGMPDFDGDVALPAILYPPFTFSHALLTPIMEALGDRLRLRAITSLAETQKAMVKNGIGVAWLPANSITRELAEGSLIRVESRKHNVDTPVEVIALCRKDLEHRLAKKLWDSLTDHTNAASA